ncbi:MAG: hypothetical protein MUF50_04725 [Planctomycetes bacterium]|jgi:hypothetical protein|nr:hypothetical protein [Planctomycetota bacterium]
MANQEQNLKLENTMDRIIIEPMSTPYRAFFSMKRETFNKNIDNYWEKNKDNLIKLYDYKGMKKGGGGTDYTKARKALEQTVGINTLYKYAVSDIIIDSINKKLGKDEELLLISSIKISNYEEKDLDPSVFVVFFCWPKISGITKENISFNIKRPEFRPMAVEYQGRLSDLQSKHGYKKIIENVNEISEITDKHEILLEIMAYCYGEQYEDGSFIDKWVPYKEITVDELKNCIKANLDGTPFETQYVSARDASLVLDVKGIVKGIRVNIIPEADSLLFKAEGFDDEMAFRKAFESEYKSHVSQVEQATIFDAIIDQIIINGKLGAIPEVWLERNVEYLSKAQIDKYGGDKKKALAVLGLANERQLLSVLSDQVFKNTLNQMALRCYIELFDLPSDIDKIVEHMRNNVVWG